MRAAGLLLLVVAKTFAFYLFLFAWNDLSIKLIAAEDVEEDNNWCNGLLNLSDRELWLLATTGDGIGKYCHIQISDPTSNNACEFYVKGRPSTSNAMYNGIPLTSITQVGTGCVAISSNTCYFQDDSYPLTDEERANMCSDSIVANAAAQLRYGIKNGYCYDDPTIRCGSDVGDDEDDPDLSPIISSVPTLSPTLEAPVVVVNQFNEHNWIELAPPLQVLHQKVKAIKYAFR